MGRVIRSALCTLALVALSILSVSCSASYRAQQAAERAAVAAMVREGLDNMDFVLEITQIIPRGFPTKSTLNEYEFKVKGDEVETRLPYFGESRTPVYGDQEISIVFKNQKVQIAKDFSDASDGEYRLLLNAYSGSVLWTVTIQIFDSGMARIGCKNASGDYMSYIADFTLPEKKDKE